jgi:hypothetical protein
VRPRRAQKPPRLGPFRRQARPAEPGQLARVRGRIWVVADAARDTQAALDGRPVQYLVSLVSVEDDATGEELQVIWEIEPGRTIIEQAECPRIVRDRHDDPAELEAFLDAVRSGAVTSADQRRVHSMPVIGVPSTAVLGGLENEHDGALVDVRTYAPARLSTLGISKTIWPISTPSSPCLSLSPAPDDLCTVSAAAAGLAAHHRRARLPRGRLAGAGVPTRAGHRP